MQLLITYAQSSLDVSETGLEYAYNSVLGKLFAKSEQIGDGLSYKESHVDIRMNTQREGSTKASTLV